MASRATFVLDHTAILGMNIRTDGMNRRYARDVTRRIVRRAKVNVQAGSTARHAGYPRTGRLARSIDHEFVRATAAGVVRKVVARERYSVFVHEGTANNGSGRIYSRSSGGQFASARFPIGKSQGRATVFRASVRGQRANPFLMDATETIIGRLRL